MAYTAMNTVASDAGSNVSLSNLVRTIYTQEMLLTAQPMLRFAQIVTPKTDLQATPGNTITFTKWNALTGDSTLTESTDMTPTTMDNSQVSISVGEHGKALAITELMRRTSFTDLMTTQAQILGRHYALDFDNRVRDVLEDSSNVIYSNNKADRAALTASDRFDVDTIKEAVEQLQTNKVPKFNGEYYLCFVHPHQARDIRSDSEWINVNTYRKEGGNIINGMIGVFEDVAFIETTNVIKVASADGSKYADGTDTSDDETTYNNSIDTYKSYIVGDHVVGHAQLVPVEMRTDTKDNFGRFTAVGWYSIDGLGFIENGHAFTIETA